MKNPWSIAVVVTGMCFTVRISLSRLSSDWNILGDKGLNLKPSLTSKFCKNLRKNRTKPIDTTHHAISYKIRKTTPYSPWSLWVYWNQKCARTPSFRDVMSEDLIQTSNMYACNLWSMLITRTILLDVMKT